MAYSTDQDIFDRLGEDKVRQLTDDEGTGRVDSDVLSRLRDEVTRKMDVKLRRRYTLPIEDAEAQKVLASIEADVLAYRLYQRRSNVEIPESVGDAKDDAWDQLKDISRHGGLGLDQDGDGTDDGGSTTTVQHTDRETLKDKMSGRY